MPTDQKVTGLSPVGVTLKINHLQQCRWFFRVLFRAVFTAKSGICSNQCLNRNHGPDNPDRKSGKTAPLSQLILYLADSIKSVVTKRVADRLKKHKATATE